MTRNSHLRRAVMVTTAALLAALAGTLLQQREASAKPVVNPAFPEIIVVPPPSGPVPIPYPNVKIPNPERSSALEGFMRAEEASGGIIDVREDVVVE